MGDFYKLTVQAEGPNGINENVHYFEYVGAVPDSDPNGQAFDIADTWINTALGAYVPLVAMNIVFNRVVCRGITNPTAGAEIGFTQSGGAAGENAPYQIAPYVTWLTMKFGRSYRGRTRFFPTVEAFLGGSTVDGSYTAAANAYCGQLLLMDDGLGQDVAQLYIYSTKLNEFNEATGFINRSLVSTQRRRAPGIGS